MKRTFAVLALLLAATCICTVNAQTASDGSSSGTGLVTLIVVVVFGAIFFAIIAYAAYRLIKQWSRGE